MSEEEKTTADKQEALKEKLKDMGMLNEGTTASSQSQTKSSLMSGKWPVMLLIVAAVLIVWWWSAADQDTVDSEAVAENTAVPGNPSTSPPPGYDRAGNYGAGPFSPPYGMMPPPDAGAPFANNMNNETSSQTNDQANGQLNNQFDNRWGAGAQFGGATQQQGMARYQGQNRYGPPPGWGPNYVPPPQYIPPNFGPPPGYYGPPPGWRGPPPGYYGAPPGYGHNR